MVEFKAGRCIPDSYQIETGHFVQQKNILALSGVEARFPSCPSHRLATIPSTTYAFLPRQLTPPTSPAADALFKQSLDKSLEGVQR